MSTPNDPTISHSSLDAIIAAYMEAVEAGDIPNRDDLLAIHAEHAEQLQAFFADLDRMDRVASPLRTGRRPRRDQRSTRTATAICPPSATSATTSCSRRSPAAAWASSTRPGRSRSTGSSR